MRASLTSSLPWQWSPLAWVLTRVSILPARGSAARMARSICSVRGRSKSVSISRDSSPSTISPALLQPQLA